MSVHPNSFKGNLEIPIAKRQIEFSEGDFIDSSSILTWSESARTKEMYEELDKKAIIATDGTSIYQITDTFPICQYYCSEECQLQPKNFLNTCIESITVATVNGNQISVELGKAKTEILEHETLCWYTTPLGDNRIICNNDIFELLLHKPNLLISAEGVLIFYTSKDMIATTDCEHYAWVWNPEEVKDFAIKKVESSACMTKVYYLDEKNNLHPYQLSFEVGLLDHGEIHMEFTKL